MSLTGSTGGLAAPAAAALVKLLALAPRRTMRREQVLDALSPGSGPHGCYRVPGRGAGLTAVGWAAGAELEPRAGGLQLIGEGGLRQQLTGLTAACCLVPHLPPLPTFGATGTCYGTEGAIRGPLGVPRPAGQNAHQPASTTSV